MVPSTILWHNQTVVYNPIMEQKPYILTVTSEGKEGLKLIDANDVKQFVLIVKR
jgi:hypothetical protein